MISFNKLVENVQKMNFDWTNTVLFYTEYCVFELNTVLVNTRNSYENTI